MGPPGAMWAPPGSRLQATRGLIGTIMRSKGRVTKPRNTKFAHITGSAPLPMKNHTFVPISSAVDA